MSNSKYPHGTFCWNEFVTRDMDGARKFYSELLGWKAVDAGSPEMKYVVFKSGEKDAGGMMEMPPDAPDFLPPHWMGYIAVDDVDLAASKVTELGGSILHGPQDIPNVGRFCIIQDATGGVVSLISMIES